jgi:hypothetical protein
MLKHLSLIYLLLVCLSNVTAQNNDTINSSSPFDPWFVVLKVNGTKYIAKIISDDGREVLIDTKELGKIYITKSEIKSITKITDEKNIIHGEYRHEGPFTTRYFLTTNALPIKKGENYYMIHLFGAETHFAVSDNTSIGFMGTWIASPMGLALKHNFKTSNQKLNFSLGALLGSMGYISSFRGYGALLFGNVTYGTRMSNITFSAGVANFKSGLMRNRRFNAYVVDEFNNEYLYNTSARYVSDANFSGLFSISGITKVGANTSFVFDFIYSATRIERPMDNQKIHVNDFNSWGWYFSEVDVSKLQMESYLRSTILLMPSLRFQTSDKTAFQFTIGGVSSFDKKNSINFPMPMCTWFNKL